MNAINRARSAYPDVSEIPGASENSPVQGNEQDNGNVPEDVSLIADSLRNIMDFVNGLGSPEALQAYISFVKALKDAKGSVPQEAMPEIPDSVPEEESQAPEQSQIGKMGFNPFQSGAGKQSKAVKVL